MRPHPRDSRRALVTCGGRTLEAAIGRGAIAARKREGDGTSPRGRFLAVAALARGRPSTGFLRGAGAPPLPFRPIRRSDGWCDAAESLSYNRAVRLPTAAGHERLWRQDGLYDAVLVTDHNQRPRVRGAGSAIFVHVARQGLTPTEGCIAFPPAAWRRGRVPAGAYLVGVEGRPVG